MRLDIFLHENMGLKSRSAAQELIKNGCVFVNEKCVTKPSFELLCNENITISQRQSFVSRGAQKLLGAIEIFGIDFTNKVVLDIGASTGGFTQVALIHGAKKVYAVDVGNGELAPELASDGRVINLENTDFRKLTLSQAPDVDFVVGDISFISLRHIMPHIKSLYGSIESVLLFKPQFECGAEIAKKYKGVIKNRAVHKRLLKDILTYSSGLGFRISDITASPIKGKSGNIEYLLHINGASSNRIDVDAIVDNAFQG